MAQIPALLTGALTTLENARSYLMLADATHDEQVSRAINHATAMLERMTGRKLKSRTTTDILDGKGLNMVPLSQWPITAVTAARYRSPDHTTTTALDLTGMVFTEGGLVYLPNDLFPCGTHNIEVDVTYGYLAGTHDADLALLEMACLRLVQVIFQDQTTRAGRTATFGVNTLTGAFDSSSWIPGDVTEIVNQYRRLM